MVTITEAVRTGQRALAAREAAATARLLDAYRSVWDRVEREVRWLDADIAAAVARGERVPANWLMDQAWYRQLQGSLQVEVARFRDDGLRALGVTQADAVASAREAERLFRVAIGDPFAARVNAGALERWVSATQPGSPLRGVLDGYGERLSRAIRDGITEGIGSGHGTWRIVDDLRRAVGPDATQWRLATIVRTEGMRSFRGSFADTMQPLQDDGIVTGYRWLAAKSSRTCIACIARDGRITKTYPTDQHVSCRCVAQPVVDPAIVPGGRAPETGSEWFARQPEDVQRRMLPNASAFDAYRRGEITLDDLVGVRRSRTWGDSIFVRGVPKSRRPSYKDDDGGITSTDYTRPDGPFVKFSGTPDAAAYFRNLGIDPGDLKGVTKSALNTVGDGIHELARRGQPLPARMRFVRLGSDGPVGQYDKIDGVLRWNVESAYFRSPAKFARYQRYAVNHWSSDDPRHVVYHETGHLLHYRKREDRILADDGTILRFDDTTGYVADFDLGQKTFISQNVSRYAFTNSNEFVAEVYAGHLGGQTYSDEVMEMYRKFRGPELP